MKQKIQEELEKRKKENRKEFLNKRKSQMRKEFKTLSKQREGTLTEEEKLNREKESKKEKDQALKQYFEKQKELKQQNEAARKEYMQFFESPDIQKVYEENFEPVSEAYLKFSKQQKYSTKSQPADFQMNFGAFKKFGHDMKIYPNIISFDDFSHIFKMISKENAKDATIKMDPESSILRDKETLNISFNQFKDALTRVACLAKFKLGGLQGISDEESKKKDKDLKSYLRNRWHKAATSSLKKQQSKHSRDPNRSQNMTIDTKVNSTLNPSNSKTALVKNQNSSLTRNNNLNSAASVNLSIGKHKNEPDSGRYHFEKPKKLSKEEKAQLEHEKAINAAKSFSLKSFKLSKQQSSNRGSSIPPIIYEETELVTFPEMDTENMTRSTLEALIQYLKDVIDAEKNNDTSVVKIKKAPNAGGDSKAGKSGQINNDGMNSGSQIPNTSANYTNQPIGAQAKR